MHALIAVHRWLGISTYAVIVGLCSLGFVVSLTAVAIVARRLQFLFWRRS